MATYAMMAGNAVENIIMADDKEATEAALNCVLIEYTSDNPAGIGWSYDAKTGKFINPNPIEDDLNWQAVIFPLA
jgi:hypothetical protein